MRKLSLDALAREQLEQARSGRGRSATTVFGGHEQTLRQTVMAMVAGAGTGEHASPGEATLQVLRGHVRLNAGEDSCDGSTGDYLVIPAERHALLAVDDSAVLLTVLADQ